MDQTSPHFLESSPHAAALGAYEGELKRALDDVGAAGSDLAGIIEAWTVLSDLLTEMPPEHRDAVVATVRQHPAAGMAWQDPFTRWSFDRPRGYPGDAGLLDFIYGHPAIKPSIEAATPVGRRLSSFTYERDAAVAVRERRRLLAGLLDEAVDRTGAPDILAVACGHLREVEFMRNAAAIRRIVAFDQDAESLAEIQRCYGDLPIECVRAPVGRLIVRPMTHGCFDLIYAAGLYDYLDQRTAIRLTVALFEALKPGGQLLFANFARGHRTVGYMDAFCDWRLILRDEEEMGGILASLPQEQMRTTRLFRGGNRAVIYATATRR